MESQEKRQIEATPLQEWYSFQLAEATASDKISNTHSHRNTYNFIPNSWNRRPWKCAKMVALKAPKYPGGGLDKPTDRDQRSWVFLNDPKKYFATNRKPKKNTFRKAETLKIPSKHYSFRKSQAWYDNNGDPWLLKHLVNKTGLKKYCWKYETL